MPTANRDLSSAKGQFSEVLQLVCFKLDSDDFGVDILKVQEIRRMAAITRVPRSPGFVEGVVNLRGSVIPIIDLRKRFNLGASRHDNNTRIMVVDIENQTMGLLVDSVTEILRIPQSAVEERAEIDTPVDPKYARGVVRFDSRLLIYLDLEQLLSNEEKQALNEA